MYISLCLSRASISQPKTNASAHTQNKISYVNFANSNVCVYVCEYTYVCVYVCDDGSD